MQHSRTHEKKAIPVLQAKMRCRAGRKHGGTPYLRAQTRAKNSRNLSTKCVAVSLHGNAKHVVTKPRSTHCIAVKPHRALTDIASERSSV